MTNNAATSFTVDEDSLSWFESPNMTGTPERRLILAVLERAILDYVGNDAQEAREAREWLFGEEFRSGSGPYGDPYGENFEMFSLSWVCHQLDLDRNYIRKQIFAMPKRGSQRVAPWYFKKPESDTGNDDFQSNQYEMKEAC